VLGRFGREGTPDEQALQRSHPHSLSAISIIFARPHAGRESALGRGPLSSPTGEPEQGMTVRSHTEHLTMKTRNEREFVRITDDVEAAVRASGVQEGLCLVSAMHITAGVFINDDEPGFRADLMAMLERLAPSGVDYEHHRTGEENGDAHLKNILVNHQVTVPITEGRLELGPWQQLFYAEFDGRRPKRIVIKIIGE
jgi:secondary thiamine-phosphate synthase enzyme